MGSEFDPVTSFNEEAAEIVDGPSAEELGQEFDQDAGVRAEDAPVPCEFISGSAGTGKTFLMRQRIAECETYGTLTATTGIAAVNLGATTLNSVLKYFDTESLREKYLQGSLTTALHKLALEYDNLIIDEVSMMDARQLDILYRALKEANGFKDVKKPMGIIIVGDFAQLPPIKSPWAFEADCWDQFEAGTTRLTKMWRQDQGEFLMALQAARRGDGKEAARMLTEAGVRWENGLDIQFDGTTIVPKNDQVDRYNAEALSRIQGKRVVVRSQRWGQQSTGWKLIPESTEFKLGAYVMLLANSFDGPELIYANGDCGHIEDYDGRCFQVKLVRNGEVVDVPRIVRAVAHKDKPGGWSGEEGVEEYYYPRPHRKGDKEKKYVEGQVHYYPMRLAYASTVHKSQGLSLDKIQVDFRNAFFGSAAMAYVALSRCRTLEGLRLVGMREVFENRVKVDKKVQRWL